MKENYLPWNVKIEDFFNQKTEEKQLNFLLNFAVLAPSSHNSQPWSFQVGKNSISVFLEPKRRLIYSDKNNRQAYVSLGCAIANIMIAADYYGFSQKIGYAKEESENLAATISFKKNSIPKDDKNHLIFSISRRATNRSRYENKLPRAEFLSNINSFSNSEIKVDCVIQKEKKNALADAALAASVAAMEDVEFRKELSEYVKPNTTSSKIGMPAFGMGIPTPISFFAPAMIKRFNMNKASAKKDEKLLKDHTPLFVIISSREDSKKSWIKTGEIYENIALLAVQDNLSTAMWAAPIQIGQYYKDFQKILGLTFRPQAFLRVGYPDKGARHSPRLAADELMILS